MYEKVTIAEFNKEARLPGHGISENEATAQLYRGLKF